LTAQLMRQTMTVRTNTPNISAGRCSRLKRVILGGKSSGWQLQTFDLICLLSVQGRQADCQAIAATGARLD
jgi:hypothetical protein